ncbi:TetR/AcrR family transcriptional regulator C-terminal domain-containing protein [Nonomuraea sp. B10E15]|uniref:TetR/AcrR family transcriptional regulator C-terminal domain-containing protein n=1 Tax=Nonomuraea sp. B10E15 TaxID=3153560 RepID=UPI00325C945A
MEAEHGKRIRIRFSGMVSTRIYSCQGANRMTFVYRVGRHHGKQSGRDHGMPRPRKALLSREIIATAALEMTSETGGFTVPDLARRLNVRQSSLYNHVSGRAEIIELIRQRLHEALAVRVDVTADWADVIRHVASAQRASMAKHPWVIPLLATSPADLDATITTLENVAIVLSRAGFTDRDVMLAIAMLDIVTIGASLDLVSPEDLYPAGALAQAATLARVVRTAPPGVPRADVAFNFTLDLIIEALRIRLSHNTNPR